LGGVGAGALVGEVAREGLLLRAMQRTQDDAAERDAGIRSAVLQECLPESTQRVQHGRVKRPLPELAGRDVARFTFGQNPACLGKDVINGGRGGLGGRDGCSNRTGVHPEGTEADKSCSEIGGAPAAERIKHYITCLCSPLQDVERKVEREHCEVGANSVQSRLCGGHCLAPLSDVGSVAGRMAVLLPPLVLWAIEMVKRLLHQPEG